MKPILCAPIVYTAPNGDQFAGTITRATYKLEPSTMGQRADLIENNYEVCIAYDFHAKIKLQAWMAVGYTAGPDGQRIPEPSYAGERRYSPEAVRFDATGAGNTWRWP